MSVSLTNRIAITVCLVGSGALPASALELSTETYTLPNGMAVTLHADPSLPQVTINTWFAVGSQDESRGRTGFAHLFEHLMFMGTQRVPDNQYDVIMETGGGWNNASTGTDHTNYYSTGPSELLPTLLWLDADRLEALGDNMTREKLDLQRDVVRNERRQGVENTPYGIHDTIISEALYPEGHPYQHSIIGSHEDLEAATLEDVQAFFAKHYVPANASLVVAGDFEESAAKRIIAGTFGAIPAKPLPPRRRPAPVQLDREIRRVAVDDVEHARLYLVWHSPAWFAAGDAEMDVVGDILADGASSRLHERLILREQLALDVTAYQYSKELGSEFHVQVTARPGGDLERIKRVVLQTLELLGSEGPTREEIARALVSREASFLRRMESLNQRADAMNLYRYFLGTANGFQADLDRYANVGVDDLRRWTRATLGTGRLDLRILPEDARIEGANLDERPSDLTPREFVPPTPVSLELSNGIAVVAVSRPGSGLFDGRLLVAGGERLISAEQAGLGSLTASLLTSGAAGKTASEYADAVASLGADIEADADRTHATVSVRGLSSRFESTLDLFADTVLRPNLYDVDFEREKALALDRIRARSDRPFSMAFLGARSLMFGRSHPRGRPLGGLTSTVSGLTLGELRDSLPKLLNPTNATFVFAGDFETDRLVQALEQRFAKWRAKADKAPPLPEPLDNAEGTALHLIDRPGAEQTVILLMRPIPAAGKDAEAVRATLNTVLGGSFTSRLMQNLREEHGYTYGARSLLTDDGSQFLLQAYAAVQTEVTGASLTELKRELDRLATGDVSREELAKAVKTLRQEMVDTAETTQALGGTLAEWIVTGRPLDNVVRILGSLDRVRLDNANRTARSGLYDWNRMQIVLVGDRESVLPQLDQEGFGVPEILPAESLM